jgi:hypothetical protein
MRNSTVLFVLVSIVCALAAGCSPYADHGAVAFAPRVFSYVPSVTPVPPTTLPSEPAVSDVQR